VKYCYVVARWAARNDDVAALLCVLLLCRGTSSKADAATDMDIIGSFHPEHNRMFGGKGVQVIG
jgi:hypothetical protein